MGNLTSTETELLDEIRHLRQEVVDLENRVADYQGLSFSADAVRESERLHRVTISSISDSVFITDDDGDFTYVCPNCHVIFGHTREAVLRNRVQFSPKDLPEDRAVSPKTGPDPDFPRVNSPLSGHPL